MVLVRASAVLDRVQVISVPGQADLAQEQAVPQDGPAVDHIALEAEPAVLAAAAEAVAVAQEGADPYPLYHATKGPQVKIFDS